MCSVLTIKKKTKIKSYEVNRVDVDLLNTHGMKVSLFEYQTAH